MHFYVCRVAARLATTSPRKPPNLWEGSTTRTTPPGNIIQITRYCSTMRSPRRVPGDELEPASQGRAGHDGLEEGNLEAVIANIRADPTGSGRRPERATQLAKNVESSPLCN